MNSFLQKVLLSLQVDIQWIALKGVRHKWQYLLKKYLLVAFPFLFWDNTSRSYTMKVLERKIYVPTVEHSAFLQGTYIDHMYLRHYIVPEPIVVDIGAHIGEFALVCTTIFRAKRIFSFEPVRYPYTLLTRNTTSQTYHAAVGTGAAQNIYIGTHTVTASGIPIPDATAKEVVSCISPDTIPEITSLPSIDLLKIDVEGMEYDVLRASMETVKKSRHIVIEISLHRPTKKPALHLLEFLRQHIPDIRLMHIGTIFQDRKTSQQVAVDVLLYNPHIP